MLRWIVAAGAALALAGCLEAQTVACGELLCPADAVCTPRGCASPADVAACQGMPEGAACGVDEPATCRGGFCERAVCGDGVAELGEVCDDGNAASGDGCDERCRSNETCGNGLVDLAVGEQCDEGLAPRSGDGCTSRCTVEFASWQLTSPRELTPRSDHAMVAFDGGILLFGGGATADDTWRWTAAAGWVLQQPRQSPAPRRESALVADPVRRRVYLIAGEGRTDTWAWDGVAWREVAAGPAGPVAAAFEPDSALTIVLDRERTTWTFDGTAWTRLAIESPPGRSRAVMHARADGIVLFGGYALGGQVLGDTWRYRGGAWTAVAGPAPSARWGAASAITGDGTLFVFGGKSGAALLGDAWTFDGAWQPVSGLSPRLTPRAGAALAYERASALLVMFGGTLTAGELTDQTLVRGIADWFTETTTFAPNLGCRGVVVAYPTRGQIVLVAGFGSRTYTWRGESWHSLPVSYSGCAPQAVYDPRIDRIVAVASGHTFDGAEWREGAAVPVVATEAAAVFDVARQRLVRVGGRLAGPSAAAATNQTWVDSDGAWTRIAVDTPLLPRVEPALAYDATVGRVVLYGGRDGAGIELTDTWELDGLEWRALATAAAPPSGNAIMTTGARGRPLLVTITASPTTWELQRGPSGARWVELRTIEPLPALTVPSLAYDAVRGEVILVGNAGTTVQTWRFAHRSPDVPSDTCVADSDGDGLAGCADPDCAGYCDPLCLPYAVDDCAPGRPRCGDDVCSAVEDYETCARDCALP